MKQYEADIIRDRIRGAIRLCWVLLASVCIGQYLHSGCVAFAVFAILMFVSTIRSRD